MSAQAYMQWYTYDPSFNDILKVRQVLKSQVRKGYNTGDGNSEIRNSDKKTDSALLLFLQIFITTLECLHITHEYIHLGFAVKLRIRHYTYSMHPNEIIIIIIVIIIIQAQ
jgi:hypothetical protein